MKAVRIYEFGGSDRLQVEEVEDPQLEPGHVRIKVHACALNHVDVDIREGVSRFEINFPHILGLEVVGSIAELGPDVDGDWQVGERVMPYLLGGDVFIGVAGPGGFAEYIVAPTKQLVQDSRRARTTTTRPRSRSPSAPPGTCSSPAAACSIGETVMINSVSAGIASAAVQLAKLGGAYVIGTSSSAEKLDRASGLGMDAGIDYTTEDVPARVARADRRQRRRPRLRARRRRAVPEGARVARPERPARDLRRPRRARSSRSTSSRSSAASTRSSARSCTHARSSRRVLKLGARGHDQAPGRRDLPARGHQGRDGRPWRPVNSSGRSSSPRERTRTRPTLER